MTIAEAGVLIFLAAFGAAFGVMAYFFPVVSEMRTDIARLKYEEKQSRMRTSLLIDMIRREGRDVPSQLNIDAEGNVDIHGDAIGGSKRQGG